MGIALVFSMMMVLSTFSVAATAPETRQDTELILRVAMQDDIRGLNPIIVSDVWSWNVLSYVFDGPINVNPTTDELIPYIAIGSANVTGAIPPASATTFDGYCDIGNFNFMPKDTWTGSAGVGETVIFYDFTNVKWHDSTQMSVRDIMFSMNMQAQIPEWSSSMNPLKDNGGGTGSNFSSTGWLHAIKVWESADKMQAAIKYELQEPYADFFRSTLSVFLLPEHIWNSPTSGQTSGAKIWCDPGYLQNPWLAAPAQAYQNSECIGNGPFKLVYWEVGQMIKISTNRDHFFREGYKYSAYVEDEYGESLAYQPTIDGVTYRIFRTAEAAVLALKSDDIDYIAWSVPPTFVQELANEPGVSLVQNPEQGFFYLSYNMRKTSFGYKNGDPLQGDEAKPLRKAIAHCIDKNTVVQRLLLNLGIAGEGPVSSISPWYNASIPKYSFDPEEAKNILANAGYKVKDGNTFLTGDAAKAAAGNGKWWYRSDEQPIGSSAGGLIEILTPEANYDPIRAQAGLMIAEQLRNVGIYAESVAMDFGSIVDRMSERNFDMYILGWSIGSDPTDFLHAFFHTSMSVVGQNYPGYQNSSSYSAYMGYDKCFDEIIDEARRTGNEEERKNLVKEAQASICYDLPYDVLYFRTNIEAYRSDRFTGWQVGSKGSIFTWASLYSIKAPSPYKTNAQFVSPPSAMESNSTTQITVFVKDQDGNSLEGAQVWLESSVGTLSAYTGNTTSTGKLVVTFTAPWADPTDPELVVNGTQAIIQIKEAKYTSPGGTKYDDAPSRLALIKVFPEGARFLSVSLNADPDVINPDMSEDGALGFTYVVVTVNDENHNPVFGASVALTASPAVPTIEPADQTTNEDGEARFKVTATDLPDNDGTVVEYVLTAIAIDPTDTTIQGENRINLNIVDYKPPGGGDSTPFPTFLVVASVFCVAAVSYAAVRMKKK